MYKIFFNGLFGWRNLFLPQAFNNMALSLHATISTIESKKKERKRKKNAWRRRESGGE